MHYIIYTTYILFGLFRLSMVKLKTKLSKSYSIVLSHYSFNL